MIESESGTQTPGTGGAGPGRAVGLDAHQAAASEAVLRGGNHVVLGAPGTGLTTTALEIFAAWSAAAPPEQALLLVPTRRRAAVLRDVLAARLGRTTGQVLVRTPASLAYAVLRLRASHRGEPAPTLITGPEQDSVLAELIAGHLGGDGVPIGWPEHVGEATLRLPAFRAELRDLLMRAAEAGLDGEDLQRLGQQRQRPTWVAAGALLTEYGDVMALGELTPDRGARYDAATIVDQAVVALRRWHADVSPTTRPRWDLVLHDDYQDATLATARLLQALADDGTGVVVLGDPDRAVQAFRGGRPTLLRAAAQPRGSAEGALGATRHVLGTRWRHGPVLTHRLATLTGALPPLGDEGRRAAVPGRAQDGREPAAAPLGAADAVRHLVLPTPAQEVAAVARELRVAHLRRGVPWSQMAVLVRSGSRLGELRRGLRTAGVPLAAAAPDRPLREEPAVRPLLVALRCAVEGMVSAEDAATLLLSSLGGMDAVTLRALRRTLRQLDGATTPSDRLLADVLRPALVDPRGDDAPDETLVAGLPPRLQAAPLAVQRVLAAGRAALAQDRRSTETALWAMWDATDLARDWQRRALGGGAAADRADADLDAVVALFAAAEQFTDRTTGADPEGFLDHLATGDFAADTLAARGQDAQTVAVHTAASAAGLEWDVVVVAGVQEDTWPDLRIRDTLLGAADLADVATEREVTGSGEEARAQAHREARRAVLADELRSFVAACSRARHELLLTAVLDTDERPSAFFEAMLVEGADLPAVTGVGPALDLRGLVGALRAALHGPTDRAAAAAQVLAHLAGQGVAEADPATWPDLRLPTTDAPAHDRGAPVPVSPSAVERAASCPLHWLLTTAGGRPPSTRAQDVGNLVHEIAAAHPHGTLDQLRRSLELRWHELGLPDSWVARRDRARAEEMIRKLALYVADHPERVETEVGFETVVGGARLAGRMDRVEHRDRGLHVVDLKTGTSAPSKEATLRHAQLGTYQLAVTHGAVDGGDDAAGGSLVHLGTPTRTPSLRQQPPLPTDTDPGWAGDLVAEVVEVMTGSAFLARRGDACGYCPVRTSCPAQPEGGRVVPGEGL